MSEADQQTCGSCGAPHPAAANFCEACGHDLDVAPAPTCTGCGEAAVADDGYCNSCGQKQPEERDHQIVVDGDVAAGSDRGQRHRHNEDSFAVAALPGGGCVLVVCDGVSSTPGSAEASLRAAVAARDTLVKLLANPEDRTETAREVALIAATEAAQGEASQATELPSDAPYVQGGPPSSTFVALVAVPSLEDRTELSVAWIGDSRAYWLGPEANLLTIDHELGGSLTRWIGADSPVIEPDTAHLTVDGPGTALVCSDGLWRYAAEASEMMALLEQANEASGSATVERLLQLANEHGGHDNISVALWPVNNETNPDES